MELGKFEIAICKRTAQNVKRFRVKKNKLMVKIAELNTEVEKLDQIIETFEKPVMELTGGLTSEEVLKNLESPEETTEDQVSLENEVEDQVPLGSETVEEENEENNIGKMENPFA